MLRQPGAERPRITALQYSNEVVEEKEIHMVKRSINFKFTILALALMIQPVAQAQSLTIPDRGEGRRPIAMRISSYEDDPFVALPLIQRTDPSSFDYGQDGRPIL